MTFAPEAPRPIEADDCAQDVCSRCDGELDESAGWDYCPWCGDSLGTQPINGSEWACSCTGKRMTFEQRHTTEGGSKGKHECTDCGAIWIGIERPGADRDRDPDEWNLAKAEADFAEYLAATFGFNLPRKAVKA